MSAVHSFSRTLLLALLAVVSLAVPLAGANEAKELESVEQIPVLYGSHDRARFAVRFDLTEGAVAYLKDKMPRYWYLMLYTSEPLLANPGAPAVQFGFFASRQEAQQFVGEYQDFLPRLQVVSVSAEEHRTLMALVDGSQAADQSRYYWLSPRDSNTDASHRAMLERARGIYVDRSYALALSYYRVLSLVAEPEIAAWAHELNALSYERLGEHHQAISLYRDLLQRFPDNPANDRVTQRLRALSTAADYGQSARRAPSAVDESTRWHTRGVFGQSYRNVSRSGDHFDREDFLSVLVTNLDVHAGVETDGHRLNFRVQGYHLYDALYDSSELDVYRDFSVDKTDTRLRRLHLDYTHKDTGVNVVGGRQRDFRTGSFYSFDGLTVKYPLHQRFSIGATYGEPVSFSSVYDDLDHRFYSVHAYLDLTQRWRFSGYLMHQTLFGETDRLAYGGEAKYLGDNFSSYLNVDYDYEFAELNNLLLGATYRFAESHISARYTRQRSPLMSATNILVAQPGLDLENDYLDLQFNRDNLLYRALLRTSLMESGSLSYNRRLDNNLYLSTDVYQSMLSDMPVFETDDRGQTFVVVEKGAQYRYTSVGAQLMVMDFLGLNDTATLGLRFNDSSTLSAVDLNMAERLRFGDRFSATPSVTLRYSEHKENDISQARVGGKLALQYRVLRNAELRLEAGTERYEHLTDKNTINSFYWMAGYQARF